MNLIKAELPVMNEGIFMPLKLAGGYTLFGGLIALRRSIRSANEGATFLENKNEI